MRRWGWLLPTATAAVAAVHVLPDGPVLLTVTSAHGVHVVDGGVAAIVVTAAWIVGAGSGRRVRRSGIAAIAAVIVGSFLIVAGLAALVGWSIEIPLAVAAIAAAGAAAAAVSRGGPLRPRRSPMRTAAAIALVAATAADVVLVPTGTVWGAVAAAVAVAVSTTAVATRVAAGALAISGVAVCVASMADIASIDVAMSTDQGAAARSAAFGAVVVVAAVDRLAAGR